MAAWGCIVFVVIAIVRRRVVPARSIGATGSWRNWSGWGNDQVANPGSVQVVVHGGVFFISPGSADKKKLAPALTTRTVMLVPAKRMRPKTETKRKCIICLTDTGS